MTVCEAPPPPERALPEPEPPPIYSEAEIAAWSDEEARVRATEFLQGFIGFMTALNAKIARADPPEPGPPD